MLGIMRLMLASLALASVLAAPKFSHPDRIRYDGQCFTIDGKDLFLFSGAFHYFRCPRALWPQRFKAIKDAGFNAVETYVAWNWSEREKPKSLSDDSKIHLSDLDAWLTMAEKQFGLYTIVRPGPYICSEWATGGFPNWLMSYKPAHPKYAPMWLRTDDPVFEDWSKHWIDAVAKVVAKHQLDRQPKGGHGVIMWQVENEYDFAGLPNEIETNYTKFLTKLAEKDGIDVPIFTCWTSPVRNGQNDPVLKQVYDCPNLYPRWNIEDVVHQLDRQHQSQPYAPKMVTEFQGGWFGQVGGLAAEEQDGIGANQINALTLIGLQDGMAGCNYYMLFGGTNFGDWAGQNITTSYDYFAPIREWGGEGDKYRVVQAIGRMLQQYGPDMVRSEQIETPFASDHANVLVAARKGKSGATYLFIRNTDRRQGASGHVGPVAYKLGPFGMKLYRYVGDATHGKWLAQLAPAPTPSKLPAAIRLRAAQVSVGMPTGWKKAPAAPTVERLGIWDSRFVAYLANVPKTAHYLWLKNAGGELVGNLDGPGKPVQGGRVWPVKPGALDLILLNPGWPNGGSGMEDQRGISESKLLDQLPQGVEVTGWKGKHLADPKDRSLVGENVDTSGWSTDVGDDFFPPHTTEVIRATVDLGQEPSSKLVFNTAGVDDEGWFYVNGHLVGEVHHWDTPATYPVGKVVHPGENSIAVVIRNNDGRGGISGPMTIEAPLPTSQGALQWKWTDQFKPAQWHPYGLDASSNLPVYDHPKIEGARRKSSLQVISQVRFQRPRSLGGAAWEIVLKAGGDGFLTLNGEPLGRYWEVGPQRAYFLPANMLKTQNVLQYHAVAGRLGDRIVAAELRPLPMRY